MNFSEFDKGKACFCSSLTQETLSYLSDIELSTLNRIELGKANTSLTNIISICEALNIHPKILFDFEIREKLKT